MHQGTGFFLNGVLLGLKSEPWARDGKGGTNHRLGVAREYLGQYGEEQQEVISVDVPESMVSYVSATVNTLRGELVAMPVVVNSRKGGRDGAWLSVRLPKDAQITPVRESKPAVAQARTA